MNLYALYYPVMKPTTLLKTAKQLNYGIKAFQNMYVDHSQAIQIMKSILSDDASKESITERLYDLKKKLLKEITDTDAFIVEQDYHESDWLYFEALKFIDKTNWQTLAWFHSPVKAWNKKIMKKIEKLKKKNGNKKLRFKYDNEEESFETKMAKKRQRKLEMEEAKAREKEKLAPRVQEISWSNNITQIEDNHDDSASFGTNIQENASLKETIVKNDKSDKKESLLRITEDAVQMITADESSIGITENVKNVDKSVSTQTEKKTELVMNVEKLLVKDRSLKNEELKDFMKTITMLAQIIKSYGM